MSAAVTTLPRVALVVDDEPTNRLLLRSQLKKLGYEVLEAANGKQAVEVFAQDDSITIVFMDVMMPEMDGLEATRLIKQSAGNLFVPVIFLTAMEDDNALGMCVNAGGDDFLKKPFDKLLLQAKIQIMERIYQLNGEVRGMYALLHREQEVAEQFFNRAVQKNNVDNPCLQELIRPAGIFSGDMFLSAYSPSRNLHVLLGDFTGHGLTAALGALPVSEVFRAMTLKGFSSEEILDAINKKMRSMLPPGMFLAAYLISIDQNLDHIKVFNCGMQDLLLLDGQTQQIKRQVKSSSLPLGILADINVREAVQYVSIERGDRILMLSDGVVEARNAEDEEYGWDRLSQVLNSVPAGQSVFEPVFASLDQFCGDTLQGDDVSLVEIECQPALLPELPHHDFSSYQDVDSGDEDWGFVMEFKGPRLRTANPVPLLINNLMEMEQLDGHRQTLYTILTEMFVNALDHGLLGLQSSLKANPAGFAEYFAERESRLQALDCGSIAFSLNIERHPQSKILTIRVEDSGAGFSYADVLARGQQNQLSGRGLMLLHELCDSVQHLGKGNITEVIYSWKT